MKHIKKTKGGIQEIEEVEKKKNKLISPKVLQMKIEKNEEQQKNEELDF